MAQLPPVVRFPIERYPDAPEWFKPFLDNISSYTEALYMALSRNLSFADNISSKIQEFTITASATAAGNIKDISVDSGKYPIGVTILMVTNVDNNLSTLTSAPGLDWNYINGKVLIKAIYGLTSGTNYRIKILIIYQ